MRAPAREREDLRPLVLLALFACALLLASWKRWADFWGDSGYNLYVFWQVAEGKLLYRDVTYFHGPLAPLVNGLVFRYGGSSILTIALFHFATILAILALLYRFLGPLFGRGAAALAGFYFLAAFAFAQTMPALTFNYMMPYKPEVNFAILFALGALLAWRAWIAEAKPRFAFFTGLCWGATFLLSMESAAALTFGLFGALALTIAKGRAKGAAAPLWLGFALPPLAIFLYFLIHVPAPAALRSTLAAVWLPEGAGTLLDFSFYREIAGLHDPLRNFAGTIGVSLLAAALVGALYAAAPMLGKVRPLYWLALFLPSVLIPAWRVEDYRTLWWTNYPYLMLPALLLFLALEIRRLHRSPGAEVPGRIAWAGFLLFALALLPKIFLHPRIDFYGFFLGFPGAMALVAFFAAYLPERLPQARAALRGFFGAAVVALGIAQLVITQQQGEALSFVIGSGGDSLLMLGDAKRLDGQVEEGVIGLQWALALRWLDENVSAGEPVLFLPENDMMQYLSRHPRPTPFHFGAFFYQAIGEGPMLAALAAHPPRYLAFVSNDFSQMGYGIFGVDPKYGRQVRAWAEKHYELVKTFGGSPFAHDFTAIWFYRYTP